MSNWGILATGKIARSFVRDLALVPGAEAVAVGSPRGAPVWWGRALTSVRA